PSAAHAVATTGAAAAKPFRILCAGQLLGPYSLDEVRKLLGKLGPGDMVGMECWLPAPTLAGLVGSGKAAAGGGGLAVVAGVAIGAAVGIGAAAALSSAGAHEEHVPEVDVKAEEEP